MDFKEYSSLDALGVAGLVKNGDVSPREMAMAAVAAMEAVNGQIKAVVEVYPDRTDSLSDEVADGPFSGVPFLIKDVGGHEKGRKIEFGSRLCKDMVADYDTNLMKLLRASGANVLGRSNAPEYSIAGSTENLLYGNTSTPWRLGYSAGGSSGGAAAAVAAGIVPLAHGSDIAGSIRIPAAWCGGVGLKPSRGRVSAGPVLDEAGFGLAMNFVQSRTMRDTAAMLDCLSIPQPGDPFVVARPAEPYSHFVERRPKPLRIAWTTKPLMDRRSILKSQMPSGRRQKCLQTWVIMSKRRICRLMVNRRRGRWLITGSSDSMSGLTLCEEDGARGVARYGGIGCL